MATTLQRPERPSGRDLAAERVRRGLKVSDVAERLGVSKGRVTTIEQRIEVPEAFAERYFKAIGVE
jgi:DNA-binding transcriptional regulator YiaG